MILVRAIVLAIAVVTAHGALAQAVTETPQAIEEEEPRPGPPPPLPDISDPNGRAGEALNQPGERSDIPKALRSSGSRAGGPANDLNPSGRAEAPAPPKGSPQVEAPRPPQGENAGADMISQMFRTGAEVQEQNLKAMQQLFESFWPSAGTKSATPAGDAVATPNHRPSTGSDPASREPHPAPRPRRGRPGEGA